MNNYYYSSGYRDNRARDQAGLSNAGGSRAQRGFVAPPGVVAPAPAPPGYTVPPAAVAAPAAAAPFGAAAFAGVGGVLAGLGLGAWVKEDIDRFNRNAKLPWYDANYPYRGSPDHWTLADWDLGQEVGWDPYADAEIRRAIDRQVQEYYLNPLPMPPGFYAPDGRHGPTFTRTTGVPFPIRVWWEYVNSCPDNPASTHWGAHQYTTACIGYGGMTYFDTAGGAGSCDARLATGGGVVSSEPIFQCPINVNGFATVVGGWSEDVPGFSVKLKEAWDYREAPASQTSPVIPPGGIGYGVGIIGTLTAVELAQLQGNLGWAESVAPAGTQPSIRPQRGLVVPFIPGFPIQIMDPGTGPPMTVPDVVVDAGGVTPVHPTRPLPPIEEKPPEGEEEQKPTLPGVGGRAWMAVNFATEAQDVLDALHKAIPKKCRTKPRKGGKVSPHIILQDVWRCRSHFSADKFVMEFINNQVEDFLYGKLGQAAGRVQRATGGTTGLSRAANAGSRFYGRAVKAGELPSDEWSPIPQMSRDDETGAIYLDVGSYHIRLGSAL